MQAIQNISSAEFSLCKVLKVGVETYLRPLKSALTEESYDKIFQGIPEVYGVHIVSKLLHALSKSPGITCMHILAQ